MRPNIGTLCTFHEVAIFPRGTLEHEKRTSTAMLELKVAAGAVDLIQVFEGPSDMAPSANALNIPTRSAEANSGLLKYFRTRLIREGRTKKAP
jgi:hypothetical protein